MRQLHARRVAGQCNVAGHAVSRHDTISPDAFAREKRTDLVATTDDLPDRRTGVDVLQHDAVEAVEQRALLPRQSLALEAVPGPAVEDVVRRAVSAMSLLLRDVAHDRVTHDA